VVVVVATDPDGADDDAVDDAELDELVLLVVERDDDDVDLLVLVDDELERDDVVGGCVELVLVVAPATVAARPPMATEQAVITASTVTPRTKLPTTFMGPLDRASDGR
jgi:hypothetical protein